MYFFFYFCLALFSAFISVYLMDLGYKATQVSFVVACSYIVSMITQPFIGSVNDKLDKKKWNAFLLTMTIIVAIIFIFLRNIYAIAIAYSTVLALMNSSKVVVESMATLSRHAYGSIRVWATIGYAVASKISGYLYQYIAPQSLYIVFSIGMVLCIIGILGTQDVRKLEKNEQVEATDKVLNKNMFIYLVIVCIFYGVTNVNTLYLPAMLQSKGIQMKDVSTIIFISTLAEVPVIMFAKYYMNRLTNKQLLLACFSLLLTEFSVLTFIDNLIVTMIIIFLTKAVATMSFIMINLKVVASIVDSTKQNTALSIVSSCNSFSSIIFQMIAGYLIDYTSYQIFYFVLLVCSVLGILIVTMTHLPTNKKIRLFN